MDWKKIEELLEEMITFEQKKLLDSARRIVPTLTPEDLLQPNDYPELESNPHFRYDEGLVAGLLSAQTALQALKNRS